MSARANARTDAYARVEHYSCNKNARSIKSRSALRTICVTRSRRARRAVYIKIQIPLYRLLKHYLTAVINRPPLSYKKREARVAGGDEKETTKERDRVRSTLGEDFDRDAVSVIWNIFAPLTISRADPIFPLSFPHPGNAFYPQTSRTKRSCGPGFPRSTPSAGTPRELSAKRQYALRRRLSIHPDLTLSPWPFVLERSNPLRVLSAICNLAARFLHLSSSFPFRLT